MTPSTSAWLLRIAALVAVAWLYLSTRQHIFTIDSLYYLWDSEFGDWTRLLHPHHLALQPLMRGFWSTWLWFDWPGRAIVPLQVFNVLVTLGALTLMWRLLTRLVARPVLAGFWWAVAAVSYVGWYHATQIEGVPLFALFATANLCWAVWLPGPHSRPFPESKASIGLALTMAGGVLVHQSLVLWTPLLSLMAAREALPGRRLRVGFFTLALAGGVVVLCYVAAGFAATSSLVPADLWRWFTGYSHEFSGRCGSLRLLFSLDVPRGLASSLLTGAPLKPYVYGGRSIDAALFLRLVPLAVTALVLGIGMWGTYHGLRTMPAPRRRSLVNITALVLLGVVFAGWWEPSNRKFWMPVLPGLLAISAAGWSTLGGRGQAASPVVAGLLAAILLGFNLAGGILPRHDEHDGRQPLLVFMARHVQPLDAVVLQEDRVWQCAIYFRSDHMVHGIPGPRSDRGDAGQTVWHTAVADARRALVSGGTLFVAKSEWPRIAAALAPELGPFPPPVDVLFFGDADLGEPDQVLLAVSLPRG